MKEEARSTAAAYHNLPSRRFYHTTASLLYAYLSAPLCHICAYMPLLCLFTRR